MSEEQTAYSTKVKTIFRTKKNADNPFVMMDRRPIENADLSWKAKGILAYLLSRPDNWTVRLGDLVKRSTDGTHAIRAAIKELISAGHVFRREIKDEKGRFLRYELEVYEIPFTGSPLIDFPQADNPQPENHTLNNTDYTENKKHGDKSPDTSGMPWDWKLSHDIEITAKDLDQKDAQMRDAAHLIATGLGINSIPAFNLAYAFMVSRQILIPETKIKGQRKAVKEMLEMHVFPVHVVEAVKDLTSKGMTIVDLFSVSKTAIALANPAPEGGNNPLGLEVGT